MKFKVDKNNKFQGAGVIRICPNKQDRDQTRRKVQSIYRKKKQKINKDNDGKGIWKWVINICVIVAFILFVIDIWFDIGLPLPTFLGR